MADIVKDVTIRFTAETRDLEKSSGLFDQINKEVSQQNALLDQNAKKHKETGESASKAVKNTEDSFKKFGDTLKNIGAALGVAFSVGAIVNFAKESVKAFQESEVASKKLEFALKNIAKEGAAAFAKLTAQADKLSKISIFDDESIKNAQTQLAQFGLQSKAIESLLPQIVDLASATGIDLAQATDLAIAGINGQGRALKPYGIILDDTGDKTKNLSILQEGLAKFTGAAGDSLNTAAGQAKFFDNQVNELQESIGQRLSPALSALKIATLQAVEGFLDLFSVSGRDFQTLTSQAIGFTNEQAKSLVELGFALEGNNEQIKKSGKELLDFKSAVESVSSRVSTGKANVSVLTNELKKQEVTTNEGAIKFNILKEAIDKLNESTKKIDLGPTAKGIGEAAAAAKRAEEQFKATSEAIAFDPAESLQNAKDVVEKEQKIIDDSNSEKLKKNKELIDQLSQQASDATKKKEKDDAERDEKERANKEATERAKFDLIVEAGNALFEFQNQQQELRLQQTEANAERDRQIIEAKVANGILSEEQGADAIRNIDLELEKEKKEAARRQAIRDKAQALFNIGINTAQAVTAALATANVPLSIIVASIGAIQAALVAAKPIPEFAEGVIDLKGGVRGKDSIPAVLMPGESVMTTDETSRHKELLQSIRNDRMDEYMRKASEPYVNMKLKEYGVGENMANSIKLNHNFPDEYALNRVMRRNKEVEVGNADYLAQKIASEINKNSVKRLWSD